jgi:hypothetical protein
MLNTSFYSIGFGLLSAFVGIKGLTAKADSKEASPLILSISGYAFFVFILQAFFYCHFNAIRNSHDLSL